jgi:methionyl-tRNA formyltransferase
MSEINKVLFIGSKPLGLACLKTIHSLFPDKLSGVLTIEDSVDCRSAYPDFVNYCSLHKIKLHCAKSRKESEEIILNVNPEICFVVNWYWLISPEVLNAVPDGFIGMHNSLLPKYRGSSPLVWSIINGDKEVGYSLFSFSEGMDDGPIWHQYKKQPTLDDSIQTLLHDFENSVGHVLTKIYPQIVRRELTPKPQSTENTTYCAQRIEKDGLVDWTKSAMNIFNFIRAQSRPYPGAFTYYKGNKLILWKAKMMTDTYFGTPGQVAKRTNQSIFVICGDTHAIELFDVSYLGKDALSCLVVTSLQDRFDNGYLCTDGSQ